MAKFVKKIGLAVVASTVLIVLGLGLAAWYTLRHPDRYLPQTVAYLHKKTGLHVEIQHATLQLLPLTLRLYGVAVKNPKPFPQGDFLDAPEVDVSIPWTPLLHNKVSIRSLVVVKPIVHLISDPDGLWNFQNPAATNTQPARFSMGTISNLQIEHGTLISSVLIDPMDKPGPVVFTVEDFSGGVQQLDINALKNTSDQTTITGSLSAASGMFGKIHLREIHSQLRIQPAQFTFKAFTARTYQGNAAGDFTFNFTTNRTLYNTDLRVSGVGINYLMGEFQTGPPKITGMMNANMQLNGIIEHSHNPLTQIQGTGHFAIQKGQFTSLKETKSMASMARFRDPGTSSLPLLAFSSFDGDLDITHQQIISHQVAVNFYGINVVGSGDLDDRNSQLDYRGTATIETKQGFFVSTFARMFKGADSQHGRLVFPIQITGTASNPKIAVVD